MKRLSEEISRPAIGSIWTTVDSAKSPYRVEYECIAEADHFGAPYFKMRCVKTWKGSEKVQGSTLVGDEMEVELPWFMHRGIAVT